MHITAGIILYYKMLYHVVLHVNVVIHDHLLVVMWFAQEEKVLTKKMKMYEQIKMRKLHDVSVCKEVQKAITEKLKSLEISKLSVEEAWQTFRDILLETRKEKCGTRKHRRGPRKVTAW